MKMLLVDADFTSRTALSKNLSEFGHCDVALNGNEAIEGFQNAWDEWETYDLICLDIAMPQNDDHQTLKQIRQIEKEKGKHGLDGVKIIITSALKNRNHVKTAFREQCDAYLIKPITKEMLVKELKNLELINN